MRRILPKMLSGSENSGFIIPTILSFMIALSIITGAVVILISSNISLVDRNIKSQQAFNIAEAGINYYLWHLSHSPTDYKDGQTTPATPDATLGYGPYVHNYIDSNANTEGTFTLWLQPQSAGSTVVKVRSIGQVAGTNTIRTVEAQIGAPSFASYAILADSALWFGNTEAADGPVHSNQGIRMDGSSNSDITSSNTTYVPPGSVGGDGASHPGVWCSLTVTTPVDCATRSKADWRYPTPLVDFNQISGALCNIKKLAFAADPSTAALATQATACSNTGASRTASYIPQRSSSANTSRGYLIILDNSGTYDLYRVNNENDLQANYTSALNSQLVATDIPIPSNGVIFAEDNVWVLSNPTFQGRLTIAAGRLATAVTANIKIADDLVYSTKNGSDALGLIAEGDVIVAPYAAPSSGNFTLEINAAVIAQNGDVVYPSNYSFSNNTCTRGWIGADQKLYFYGSIAVRQTWTWSWLWGGSCGNNVYDSSSGYYISGFKHNTTQYDYNLLYAPPPSFPITSSYNILAWREVLVSP